MWPLLLVKGRDPTYGSAYGGVTAGINSALGGKMGSKCNVKKKSKSAPSERVMLLFLLLRVDGREPRPAAHPHVLLLLSLLPPLHPLLVPA